MDKRELSMHVAKMPLDGNPGKYPLESREYPVPTGAAIALFERLRQEEIASYSGIRNFQNSPTMRFLVDFDCIKAVKIVSDFAARRAVYALKILREVYPDSEQNRALISRYINDLYSLKDDDEQTRDFIISALLENIEQALVHEYSLVSSHVIYATMSVKTGLFDTVTPGEAGGATYPSKPNTSEFPEHIWKDMMDLRTGEGEKVSWVLIHEAFHRISFVPGMRKGKFRIIDPSYKENKKKFASLTPQEHMENADSYTAFVMGCANLEFVSEGQPASDQGFLPSWPVAPGDTLWDIAFARYGRGSLFHKIATANQLRSGNPNVIYPGEVLKIPVLTEEDKK